MTNNPLVLYIDGVTRIASEIDGQMVWRCRRSDLDNLRIVEGFVKKIPDDYQTTIARLRESIEADGLAFGDAKDLRAIRSIETELFGSIAAGNRSEASKINVIGGVRYK